VEVWAIVVAAGSGARFGGPKQFEKLGGKRLFEWAVLVAAQAADGVVLVLPAQKDARAADAHVVAGGDRRSDSVRAGLAAIPDTADVIVVHDAARPFAGRHLFDAVIEAVLAGADGAIPGVPVADTVKRVTGDDVAETFDRSALVAVQTPQAFTASALRKAHAGDPDASDDAALVEAQGGRVVVVAGDPANYKITTPRDMAYAEWFMGQGGKIG